MNLNDFIAQANQAFQSHEPEVNPQDIWQAIEGRINVPNKPNKRRWLILFWIIGALIIAGAGLAYLTWDTETQDSNVAISHNVLEQLNGADKTISEPIASTEGKSSLTNKNKEYAGENNFAVSDKQVITVKKENIQLEKISSTQNRLNSEPNINPAANQRAQLNEKKELNKIDKSRNAESVEENRKLNEVPVAQIDRQALLNNQQNAVVKSAINKNAIINSDDADNKTVLNDKNPHGYARSIQDQNDVILTQPFDKNDETYNSVVQQIQHQELSRLSINSGLNGLSLRQMDDNSNQTTPSNKLTKKWTLSLSSSLGFYALNRSLRSTSETTRRLTEIRAATEQPDYASSLGALIGLKNRSGFYVQTGIQHTVIHETLDARLANKIRREEGPVEFEVTEQGDTIILVIGLPGPNDPKYINNKYSLIEVPLIVGFEKSISKKWSASMEGGFIANLRLNRSGEIIGDRLALSDLDNAHQENYKSSIGLGYYAGIRINYLLTDQFSIYLNPSYRHNPSLTQNNYSIDQSYDMFGANIGLNYRFN